jgi:hypothetical protein
MGSLGDRLIGYLPRYAPYVATSPWLANKLANLRKDVPRLRGWSEQYAGLSAKRSLPQWRRAWQEPARRVGTPDARTVAFFADTFNRYFEPENIKAALDVLTAAGLSVELPPSLPSPARGGGAGWGPSRPLCCGRTFLAVGLVDEARKEAERCVAALAPFVGREFPSSGSSRAASSASATRSRRWSRARIMRGCWRRTHSCSRSFWRARRRRARSKLLAQTGGQARRCCTATAIRNPSARCRRSRRPRWYLDLAVETVETSVAAWPARWLLRDTIDVSLKMAELSLPAVRKADADTAIVADGTSCRHQIEDGADREALHVARVLGDEPLVRGWFTRQAKARMPTAAMPSARRGPERLRETLREIVRMAGRPDRATAVGKNKSSGEGEAFAHAVSSLGKKIGAKLHITGGAQALRFKPGAKRVGSSTTRPWLRALGDPCSAKCCTAPSCP